MQARSKHCFHVAPKPSKKRGYHHGNLRRALMDQALELVREGGPHAVTMREAARRIGVSSGAPYKHFADQDELMRALSEEGFERMKAVMDEAVAAAGDDALERFRAMGIAYVQFAVANPEYFRIMSIPEFVPRELESRDDYNGAVDHILDSQRTGRMASEDPQTVMLAAHCLMHGLAHLFVDGYMSVSGIGPDQAETVARAVTEVLGRGLLPR